MATNCIGLRSVTVRGLFLTFAVGALTVLASTVRAAVATFQEGISPSGAYDVEDSDIRDTSPTSNTEGNPRWNAGVFGTTYRTAIAFPLSLPINSVVYRATIDVRQSSSGSVGTQSQVSLYEITNVNYTNETTVTWNSANTGSPWTTAGGDFNGTVLSAVTPTGIVNNDPYTFASSPAFVAAVNNALAGDGVLRLMLKMTSESNGSLMSFWASDSGSDAISGFGTSVRPLLTLNYVPEPASLGVLAIGCFAMMRARAALDSCRGV